MRPIRWRGWKRRRNKIEIAGLEMVKEALHRHARAREDQRAAENFRVGMVGAFFVHGKTIRPVDFSGNSAFRTKSSSRKVEILCPSLPKLEMLEQVNQSPSYRVYWQFRFPQYNSTTDLPGCNLRFRFRPIWLRIILWDSHSSLSQKYVKSLNSFSDTLAVFRGKPLGLLPPLPHRGRV